MLGDAQDICSIYISEEMFPKANTMLKYLHLVMVVNFDVKLFAFTDIGHSIIGSLRGFFFRAYTAT